MRHTCLIVHNQKGTSIIEVMIAVTVFIIIMIGGLNYFTLPQSTVAREKIKRLAFAAAHQRMETLLALDYTAITADSNEASTPLTLATKAASRNTTVTEVDDAADGLGGSDADSETVDYKSITIEITWNDGNNKSASITTNVSEF